MCRQCRHSLPSIQAQVKPRHALRFKNNTLVRFFVKKADTGTGIVKMLPYPLQRLFWHGRSSGVQAIDDILASISSPTRRSAWPCIAREHHGSIGRVKSVGQRHRPLLAKLILSTVMGVFAARDTFIANVDDIARPDIAADNKVTRVRQGLGRHAEPDCLRNIAGGYQVLQNFTGSRGRGHKYSSADRGASD